MSEPWKRKEVIGDCMLYLGDCMEIMPALGRVDAVVTDPPYGINFAAQPTKWQRRAGHKPKEWDAKTLDFVQKLPEIAPAIIWGGNYYPLPMTRGWLSWFKPDAPPSMGHFELAWTSLDRTARQFKRSIGETNAERVGHPTQKPLELMKWCLGFLPDAELILDPFMGSGTTGVACAKLGKQFIGIEIDESYFEIACRRIHEAYRQPDMFVAPPPVAAEQTALDLPMAEINKAK